MYPQPAGATLISNAFAAGIEIGATKIAATSPIEVSIDFRRTG